MVAFCVMERLQIDIKETIESRDILNVLITQKKCFENTLQVSKKDFDGNKRTCKARQKRESRTAKLHISLSEMSSSTQTGLASSANDLRKHLRY